MQTLARKPADAYRRVDLEARIEAGSPEALTRICLEEAVAALGQAMLALEREPGCVPAGPIARAQGIALWLARNVSPENPLHAAMTQFYQGLALRLGQQIARAEKPVLKQIRKDFSDLLEAAG